MSGFRALLSVVSAGFEPLGVVMGAVALQIIQPTGCWGVTGRTATEPMVFPGYEQAVWDAWQAVIDRLEADAVRAGAHGVIGVGLTEEGLAGARRAGAAMTTLQLTGTAVRVPGCGPLRRPFLSMLTMEDTLKLVVRGWVPSGIAVGISAVHVHGWAASAFLQRSALTNVEMPGPTAGLQLARARAEKVAREALGTARAEGLVAARMDFVQSGQTCGGGQGILIEGRLLGTGVVRYRDPVATLTSLRDLSGARR